MRRGREARCRTTGLRAGAALAATLLLGLLLALPAVAAPAVFGTLDRLALDIRGAMAHVARLRDRLDEGGFGDASSLSPAAEVAGIADGRFGSTVASLRWASRGLDRRLALLRATVGTPDSPEKAEILLVMRVELSSLLWTLEELGGSAAETPQAPTATERALALDQLNASLEQLAIATSAMAGFDWGSF
ncbi:MAG: hypothetical protein H6852_05295 [Geminicoccaceae bacterium]|nr:hypothetical protein [Geminicoccaceae bacterium]